MNTAETSSTDTEALLAAAEDALVQAPLIDTAGAQLLAWSLLAVFNQLLIAVLLPAAPAGVRLLHHAYDAGQLIALGVLSFGAVKLGGFVQRKLTAAAPGLSRWSAPALLAIAVFAISLLIVGDDVENFAERQELSPLLVSVAASATFALALTCSLLLGRVRRWWLRGLLLVGGVSLSLGNALVLDGDYPAVHFMLAWLAALVIGPALEGLPLPRWRRRAYDAVLAGVTAAGVIALIVPARNDVLSRLHSLPSAVAAPFVARLLPERAGPDLDAVPARFRSSPWFQDRSRHPPVPATRALEPAKPTIVVVFTIDAVRTDVLENRKYDKFLPELHELRKTSCYFTRAWTPTPSTTTTIAALFTGRYYSQLAWDKPGDSMVTLLDDTPRFPELLSKAGVRTIHVTQLGRIRGIKGVGRGFTVEDITKRAADSIDRLIEELDNVEGGSAFLYSHFIEPHAPYDLDGKKGPAFERYVREIGIVDKQIRRFRRHLAKKGLEKNTVLIVSADHGEAFGEHGTTYHAKTIYEELLRVPMIIHVPGAPARVIDEPVTLIDVGPTVLDLFGLPTPGAFMGQSLLPLLAGKHVKLTRPIAADSGRRMQALYFDDGKKVIVNLKNRTVEVYDLKADAKELTNLAESDDPAVIAAIETTKLFFDAHGLKSGKAPTTDD